MKKLYYVFVIVSFCIIIFIQSFDYILFFEKKYGIDKLDYKTNRDYYSIYHDKMTPIKTGFTLTYFGVFICILFVSFFAFKYKEKYGMTTYSTFGIFILTLLWLLCVMFAGAFQISSIM